MSIFELIDLRSFSNIWFWLLLGLVWTRIINAPLGVPVDLIRRAQKGDAQAIADVDCLADIEVRQRHALWGSFGLFRTGLWTFSLTVLGIVGFHYGKEIAQALFVLGLPLALVAVIVTLHANALRSVQPSGTALYAQLMRLKYQVQGVGLTAVFFASIWGMYVNLSNATF